MSHWRYVVHKHVRRNTLKMKENPIKDASWYHGECESTKIYHEEWYRNLYKHCWHACVELKLGRSTKINYTKKVLIFLIVTQFFNASFGEKEKVIESVVCYLRVSITVSTDEHFWIYILKATEYFKQYVTLHVQSTNNSFN